jgi:hypothetical protein
MWRWEMQEMLTLALAAVRRSPPAADRLGRLVWSFEIRRAVVPLWFKNHWNYSQFTAHDSRPVLDSRVH